MKYPKMLTGPSQPLEALVGVVDEGEGGDDQLAGHAAELPAEPLHVLADALVRVIDVIPQHVEGVVHAAPEVEAVQVLGEVLPPAHIQQVAGELVKALQHGVENDERDSQECQGLKPVQVFVSQDPVVLTGDQANLVNHQLFQEGHTQKGQEHQGIL